MTVAKLIHRFNIAVNWCITYGSKYHTTRGLALRRVQTHAARQPWHLTFWPQIKWATKTCHVKGKGRVLAIALLTWVRLVNRSGFTILEVAADWHELMIPWRITRPSIARDNEQLGPRCSTQTYHCPSHPVASKLLFISRPAKNRRLSWPEHTVG